ncbi:MAG: MGMT family protein [Flavobacteriales bacterium]|jgi:methylated-DNA-protein-cysteine methyltransferase-like protein
MRDVTGTGSFADLVYDIVRQVPPGRVTSYGAIARCIGTGKSSRMVGWVMNRAPADVPAHRVVNRLGVLTGKQAFGHPERMQELLGQEGVQVVNDAVADFARHFWDPLRELT